MARMVNRLSSLKVAALKTPGLHADGNGLYLQVTDAGSRSWIFRFQIDGKQRNMGIGPLSAVSLAQARQKAVECRSQRAAGVDPIQARDAVRAGARATMTFQEAAAAYIAAKQDGWRNARHRQQWPETMEAYVYPVIGAEPVSTVDNESVLKVLNPIWKEKPETASRVRGRIESILGWAKANGHRSGDNPARWRDHLSHSLAARPKSKVRVVHHPAIAYGNLPTFMQALRGQDGTAARALEFVILTATRSGEVRGARWDEIDTVASMWVVPAARMKGGTEHRVPLSGRALAILHGLPRGTSPLVFDGRRSGRPLAHNGMRLVLERLGIDCTVHGFRSTFRDWAAETTNHPREVVEMALAHAVGNAVEAAYRRGDLFEKRRKLMDEWAAFCA